MMLRRLIVLIGVIAIVFAILVRATLGLRTDDVSASGMTGAPWIVPEPIRAAPEATLTPPTQPPVGNIATCGTRFIPSATVAVPPRILSQTMVTPTTGWETYSDRVLEFSVLRTTDGGTTWQAVLPRGLWSPLAGPTTNFGTDNFWVILRPADLDPLPTSEFVTFHTGDGGQTWQCGEVFVPGGAITGITFADPLHGQLLVNRSLATDTEDDAIFDTDDGGMHWKMRSLTS